MKRAHILHLLAAIVVVAAGVAGCDAPRPDVSTPTSGKLTVFVDEAYAPLIQTLADTFMQRSPNARLTLRVLPARMAVQSMLDDYAKNPSSAATDTSTSTVIILGRRLLKDESDLMTKAQLDVKEYAIAYDGIALAVPVNSALDETMMDFLLKALRSPNPTENMLNKKASAGPLRFLLTDQNSSTYSVVRALLLHDSAITAPATYYSTQDSVLNAVAAGKGVGVIGWHRASGDSARVRTLRIGFYDSVKTYHPPARVHPATLVTDTYPLKQPVYGYTTSVTNSLSTGFLAWLAKSQDAQWYLGQKAGLQPANVKIRLMQPADE